MNVPPERMNTRRTTLITFSVLAVLALAVVWAITSTSPPVTMKVLGFTAKRWPDDMAPHMSGREYVSATLELSSLGTIHEYGLGMTPDLPKAIEWYRSASDRGHSGAQDRLRVLATIPSQ